VTPTPPLRSHQSSNPPSDDKIFISDYRNYIRYIINVLIIICKNLDVDFEAIELGFYGMQMTFLTQTKI